ncbi:hypothetical protein ACO2KH_18290 [Leptospira terpstrae]|uniref:hypothetical protein n=1 Tax=Leptospira terpstrae TaxID=293075 RepID=UPI003CFCC4DA
MKTKIIFSILSIIIPISGIIAEPKRNGLFLEAIYGNPISFPQTNPNKISGDFYSNRKGTDDSIGPYVRTYGTETDNILSAMAFRNAEKPKLSGENYSIFLEYVFKSNIGLGISFNQNKYNIDNLSINKFDGNLILGIFGLFLP